MSKVSEAYFNEKYKKKIAFNKMIISFSVFIFSICNILIATGAYSNINDNFIILLIILGLILIIPITISAINIKQYNKKRG